MISPAKLKGANSPQCGKFRGEGFVEWGCHILGLCGLAWHLRGHKARRPILTSSAGTCWHAQSATIDFWNAVPRSMISQTGVLRRPKISRRRCTRSSSWSLRSWSLLWDTWRYWRKTSWRKETGEITTERATFDGTAPLVKSRSALIRGTEELLFTISEEYQNLKMMGSKFGISFAKGWCSASMLKLPL